MAKKLFIPGPTDVSKDVLEQLKKPMIGHRSKEFSEIFERCIKNLKKLLYTENEVIISTSSSTGLMEASILNCVKKKCLNFVNGAFAERWQEITVACGKESHRVDLEWGEAVTPDMLDEELAKDDYDAVTIVMNESSTGVTSPIYELSKIFKEHDDVCFLIDAVSCMAGMKIEVDKLALDVCLAGTQKAFALPPGLAVCSISEKAIERAKEIPYRGSYFDFLDLIEHAHKFQTPATPAISLLYALDYQLDKILNKEGLENRFERHRKMGELTRKWVKARGLELLPEEKYASNTVTCIKRGSIDIENLKKKLAERGYVFATGYGKLKDTTFRIGHMGDRKISELQEYLATIDEILGF